MCIASSRVGLVSASLFLVITAPETLEAQNQTSLASTQELVQKSAVDSAVSLVVSLATAAGVVGSLVAGIAGFLKARTHDPQVSKAVEDMADIGKLATDFSRKTVEQQGELKTIVEVVTNLNPQVKQALEAKQKDIEYWQERAEVAHKQLSRLITAIPEAQADRIPDLPREKKPVPLMG